VTLAEIQEFYFVRLAAAAVRGAILSGRAKLALDRSWIETELDHIAFVDQASIVAAGLAAGLRLHRFKRTMQLPRVTKVLGWLRGFNPASLLDIGSGRGAFLWPLLDALPALSVTSLEVSEARVTSLAEVRQGGIANLSVVLGDITAAPRQLAVHDIVTALEVWEHIPDVARAARHCVDLAQRAVVVSVPSGKDDNPEHVHLLTRDRLATLLDLPRVRQLRFGAVPGHLLSVATLHPDA
jgi:hypothetical protein